MLHLTAEPRSIDQLHQACTFIKTENIAVKVKLGELYVHVYYYTLNNIFI